jgi:uncharacterized protein YbjQ (UPF0145 family)
MVIITNTRTFEGHPIQAYVGIITGEAILGARGGDPLRLS